MGLMKRLALLLAGLLALVGFFMVLAPRLVSIEGVRRSLAHEIAGWSGRALTFDGTPTVAFTPYLTVTFPRVVIGSKTGQETLVVMDSLSAEIPILPLIFGGQIEPSAFDFERPVFHFAVDGDGTANWTLPRGLDATSRVARLSITDGTIGYADQRGRSIDISGVNVVLNWPGPTETASIKGSASWMGETAEFSASIGALSEFIAGRPAMLRAAITSAPLRASFNGTVQNLDGLTSSGQLSASVPSIRHLADLFGWRMKDGATLGAASIQSSAELIRGTVSLGAATVVLDGNEGEGALSLDLRTARPGLQGTLAFDALDLSAYAAAIDAAIETARATPDMPLDWPKLDQVDVDLRLSANRLLIGTRRFGRTAASAALRGGRLDIAVGEMQLYGGRLSANFSATMNDDTPSASLQGRFDQIDLGTALPDMNWTSKLDGTATATIGLSTHGASWNALVGALSGGGSLTVTQGTIGGLGLDALAAAAASGKVTTGALTNGATRFSSAKGDFTVQSTVLSVKSATINGSGYRANLSGDTPLRDPDLSMDGEVVIGDGTAVTTTPPRRVPFAINGTWQNPTLLPDFSAFLRRSDAEPATSSGIGHFTRSLFTPAR
ncbi:AsmA family protein [Kaistia dalseonensis]|uniref:AsmA protein n=1 Tax=Kaistia dalseonensis TaxID=410840 RepID=A0ABU0H8A4_9HYPH|nr:AsmA family protein [Kaistia dalseonensis]MCX5495940.1 AsmA family protein [Kaistia dalseonensis]MDQ0438543.1 AsmA protein [Kaistia dalseonensis]